MASTPALGRQRQAEFCEFKACLVYRATAHTAGATQRNLVSKKNLSYTWKSMRTVKEEISLKVLEIPWVNIFIPTSQRTSWT